MQPSCSVLRDTWPDPRSEALAPLGAGQRPSERSEQDTGVWGGHIRLAPWQAPGMCGGRSSRPASVSSVRRESHPASVFWNFPQMDAHCTPQCQACNPVPRAKSEQDSHSEPLTGPLPVGAPSAGGRTGPFVGGAQGLSAGPAEVQVGELGAGPQLRVFAGVPATHLGLHRRGHPESHKAVPWRPRPHADAPASPPGPVAFRFFTRNHRDAYPAPDAPSQGLCFTLRLRSLPLAPGDLSSPAPDSARPCP